MNKKYFVVYELAARKHKYRSFVESMSISMKASFVDLPKDVRSTIYRYCHIVRACPIDLARESVQSWRTCKVYLQPTLAGSPRQARRVGTNYTECGNPERPSASTHSPLPVQLLRVCRAMHAEIIPILYGENIFKVRLLKRFGLGYLQRLGHQALASLRYLHVSLRAANNVSVNEEESSFRVLLNDLRGVCQLLKENVPPFQMEFSLQSNILHSHIVRAEEVVLCLKRLPKMKDCAISLLHSRDKELSRIARKAALDTIGDSTNGTTSFGRPFAFDGLPKELRRLVLSHTELVIPPSNVESNHGVIHFELYTNRLTRPCCRRCVDPLKDCCCHARRAAFSTECVCPRIPSPLFHVSRRMLKESREVFFSQNRFIFGGSFNASVEIMDGIPDFGRRRIQIIDLIIPRDIDYWNHLEQSWTELVEYIKHHMNLSRLWLTIDASIHRRERHVKPRDVEDTYRSIIKPLQQLEGLQKFHVLLSWDFEYEGVAEREVMGDNYDSSKDGKVWYEDRPIDPQPPNGGS